MKIHGYPGPFGRGRSMNGLNNLNNAPGVLGMGIDIITISRMKEIVHRSGQLFLNRVFAPCELAFAHRLSEQSNDPIPYFASAFAGKEAVFKALTLGWKQDVDFRQIQVGREPDGAPVVTLVDSIKKQAKKMGCTRMLLSISYETNLAVAMVMALGPD